MENLLVFAAIPVDSISEEYEMPLGSPVWFHYGQVFSYICYFRGHRPKVVMRRVSKENMLTTKVIRARDVNDVGTTILVTNVILKGWKNITPEDHELFVIEERFLVGA